MEYQIFFTHDIMSFVLQNEDVFDRETTVDFSKIIEVLISFAEKPPPSSGCRSFA